ncbi:hypothetical protein [Egbenema bharatensis]|uniref:hypothetical protein n=1 Tax=Egbenema bharatensis TaxID=3463334 RepID=UPI003A8C1A3E
MNKLLKLNQPARRFVQNSAKLFGAAIAASGFMGLGLVAPIASATEMQAANQTSVTSPSASPERVSSEGQTLSDGVYLYGEAPEPDQIGSAYMVFEVSGAQVTGAFYLPHSSFDCFQGEFQGSQLDLMVVDSYSQTANDYSIAIQRDGYIASNDSVAVPVQIDGYHHIAEVSENDQRLLDTCRADFQSI